MMAYEVVGLCEDNNRTYESVLGTYSNETGFVLSKTALSLDKKILADRLFQLNDWHLKKEEPRRKRMTLDEIEKCLGYKVEIVEENNSEKLEQNNNDNKSTENTYNFEDWLFEQLFGNGRGVN